jgi:CDP-Glycerol:Poly(glycerophosphate) glycerophosphotransferase
VVARPPIPGPLRNVAGVLTPARQVRTRIANALRSRGFARRAAANGGVLDGAVAVFFATGPENGYQFEQWRRPLEALAQHRAVCVIVDRPDTGELILSSASLPVAFARGSAALERLVAERDISAVLYLNQVEANFRMLRFADPLHIQIGHGESDKGSSVSNQHKAYDLTFVGGVAGRDRLAHGLFDFDAAVRTVLVGRPQLDYDYPGAPDWVRAETVRVLYAPTWEGDRPSIAYGSLVSHGQAIIDSLIADARVRVIYRPHPRTGTASAAHAAADRAIRSRLQAAGTRHLVDLGGYGWQWGFADACITDISAVAYDWLATGKPMVITQPVETLAFRPPSVLLDALPLLASDRAHLAATMLLDPAETADVSARLAGVVEHYFGDTSRGASTRRFETGLEDAIASRLAQRSAR